MKTLDVIICFLIVLNCSYAQVFTDLNKIKDPIERENTRKQIEQINRQLKEISNKPLPDYSAENTKKLINEVLRGAPMHPSSQQMKEIQSILKNRGDFKEILERKIDDFDISLFDHPNPSAFQISDPYICAALASAGGKEFQIKIVKKCIDHPIVLKLGEDGLFRLLRILDSISDTNEEAVIDRLIEQGRIKKGSEFEKKWRKKLSSPNRRTASPKSSHKKTQSRSITDEETSKVTRENKTGKKWIASIAIVLLFGSLFFWIKLR